MPFTLPAITITDDLIEEVLRSSFSNYPEAGGPNAIKCIGWKYSDKRPFSEWELTFIDTEEDEKEYIVREAEMRKAFELMFTDKWPKGCTQPPRTDKKDDWDEFMSQCDNTDHDALAQLACLGEVIYG